MEVVQAGCTITVRTVDTSRDKFATFGPPEEIVSDNGPEFTAGEFEAFCTTNGIKQTLVPPYHPASNGAAERSVRILKEILIKG